MNKNDAIWALARLGESMRNESEWSDSIEKAHQKNQWFVPDFVKHVLQAWSKILSAENLSKFASAYPQSPAPRKVGIVMAGNIPLVGLHDLMCVLLSGHTALVKCSKEDEILIKKAISILSPEGNEDIVIADRLESPEAVIATGSNNTSRYFEYYFRNIPHLIRHNRTSVAVLTEKDDPTIYQKLAKDVFMYFGLGCRNVGKIYIPRDFYLPNLLDEWQSWAHLADHNKFANNYIYHRALFLMNRQEHLDTGYLLLKEDESIFSPLGCLYYERYDNLEAVKEKLESQNDEIQCVVSSIDFIHNRVPVGESQSPGLDTFADQIDTMQFLSEMAVK
jgi:hypothetical protein